MTGLHHAAQDGYPRPQLVREHWASLDGEWQFAVGEDTYQPPYEVEFDRKIIVPFPPESSASGLAIKGYIPVVWYRRYIRPLDLDIAGRSAQRPRMLLHFGAVDFEATVWLDGRQVGTHVGGHTPFFFDVTDVLASADGPLELVVRALDDPHDTEQPRGKQDWQEEPHVIWYARTTGIWQPVWLEAVPRDAIKRLRWTPDISHARVNLHVDFSRPVAAGSRLRVRLGSDATDAPLADQEVAVAGRSWTGTIAVPGLNNRQALDELLWSPEHPTLIHAQVELESTTTDRISSYFGLRSVGLSDESFLLNGRPYFLRGVLEQGYWPEHHLAAPSSDALRTEVELIKKLGFNMARVHQKVEDPRFLYWADRLGLLVWAEAPSAYTFSTVAAQRTLVEWTEAVQRDASHPSIVTWVPLNESWGVQDIRTEPAQASFSRALAALTRALDPSRPVLSNDGWEHTDSDMLTIHDYTTDAALLAQRYGTLAAARSQLVGDGPERRPVVLPGHDDALRPIILSEFGGVSYDPGQAPENWGYSSASTDELLAATLHRLLHAVNHPSGIAGFCYTQLTDTGLETNGLLFADRTPKLPIAQIHAAITNPKEPDRA